MGEEDNTLPQQMDVNQNKEELKEKDHKKTEEAPAKPPEVVLKVYMHCEGCARKVRRCLRGFQGVEDVITDCKTHKVIVKGEKADPLKVLDRVQRKSHRKVELLSPIPTPPPPVESNPEDKEKPKSEEKIKEVVTVVLSVHMHCEGCAQEIKKRILRMKGVESVDPDLKGSQVSVKGIFDTSDLLDYVQRRTGKQVVIVKTEPEKKEKKQEAEIIKEVKEEKPIEEAAVKEKKGDGDEKQSNAEAGGGGEAKVVGEAAAPATDETKAVEVIKNEYQFYPQRYAMEMYAYPPQIFSDENPNACSVM